MLKDASLSREDRDAQLSSLKDSKVPDNYISPAWDNVPLPLETTVEAPTNSVMSKAWLVGFTEAEGSFYLVEKDSKTNRIVHGFGFTQKLDEIVLKTIGKILHIRTSVRYKTQHGHYILDTTNSRCIENVIDYYKGTLKGVKSLEYRIWARSYLNDKGNWPKLHKTRDMVRKLRNTILEIV